jgi:cytochrome c oxidase subunit 1
MAIRLELLTPQGDLMQSSTYNKTFTQHGIIMVFFFLIPSIPADARNLSAADDDSARRISHSRV